MCGQGHLHPSRSGARKEGHQACSEACQTLLHVLVNMEHCMGVFEMNAYEPYAAGHCSPYVMFNFKLGKLPNNFEAFEHSLPCAIHGTAIWKLNMADDCCQSWGYT
eukprot:635133-Pelagomonas_calceolata.AAC.1